MQPVITGTGQVSNKDDSSIVHPLTMVEKAARLALDRAGVAPGEVSGVYATPVSALTRSDTATELADALGARPGPRSTSRYSGAAPQKLLAAACRAVATGEIDAAVIAGGIADASVRRARRAGVEPPAPPTSVWSQGSEAPKPDMDRDFHRDWGPVYVPEISAGAGLPASYFALVQSALDGVRPEGDRSLALGRLMAPFTRVAARRPDLAWFPVERTAENIAGASAANRMVAEPFTKLMCSFPTVDLAAAVVVTSAERAGARPVIYPRVIGAADEVSVPSGWADMARPPALQRVVAATLDLAGVGTDDISIFDLYSCFPTAVLLAARELGLEPDDERGLTATGGLPYFGGPGASYSLHAMACMFDDMANGGLPLGLLVGVGGMVNTFSTGIYSLEPVPFQSIELPPPEAPPLPTNPGAKGRAVVDAMTVLHDAGTGPVAAPIVGRTPDGARFGARLADPALAAELSGHSLVGAEVEISSEGEHLLYRPA